MDFLFNSSESDFRVKNGGWFFVTRRGGGRGGLTFVTKKVVFFSNEGFPDKVPCLDNPKDDEFDDRGGHDDADYYLVGDGGDLHPHLHGALPLDTHDHPLDAEHQLPGADPHLHGGDVRDNLGTGD